MLNINPDSELIPVLCYFPQRKWSHLSSLFKESFQWPQADLLGIILQGKSDRRIILQGKSDRRKGYQWLM